MPKKRQRMPKLSHQRKELSKQSKMCNIKIKKSLTWRVGG